MKIYWHSFYRHQFFLSADIFWREKKTMTYDEQSVNSICMNHSWNITCQHVAADIYRTKQSTEHVHGDVLKDIERVRREWKRIPYVNDIVCTCPSATHFCCFFLLISLIEIIHIDQKQQTASISWRSDSIPSIWCLEWAIFEPFILLL